MTREGASDQRHMLGTEEEGQECTHTDHVSVKRAADREERASAAMRNVASGGRPQSLLQQPKENPDAGKDSGEEGGRA